MKLFYIFVISGFMANIATVMLSLAIADVGFIVYFNYFGSYLMFYFLMQKDTFFNSLNKGL